MIMRKFHLSIAWRFIWRHYCTL